MCFIYHGVQKEEHKKFRKSSSCGFHTSDEPYFSWIQSSIKENPLDDVEGCIKCFSLEALRNIRSKKINNELLDAWVEQQSTNGSLTFQDLRNTFIFSIFVIFLELDILNRKICSSFVVR